MLCSVHLSLLLVTPSSMAALSRAAEHKLRLPEPNAIPASQRS